MYDVRTIDNFLPKKQLKELTDVMMGPEFPWFYTTGITHPWESEENKELNCYKFAHVFYCEYNATSPFFPLLMPIIEKLDTFAIIHIRAFMLTYTGKEPYMGPMHFDVGSANSSKDNLVSIKGSMTSIFYLNTNNGYTLFDDGRKCNSVANRLITFPGNIYHASVGANDVKSRVIINFNYYKSNS